HDAAHPIVTRASASDEVPRDPLFARAGLAVVLVCLALGGISALEMRHVAVAHGTPLPTDVVLIASTSRWILLAATLPFVLRVGVGESTPRLRARPIVLHLLLFLAISLLHAVVTAWANGYVSPISFFFTWSARITRAWYNTMPTMLSLYGAVLIAAWGLAEARERERRTLRASQLETQLHAARLEALRAKLQPHFLYNTLNGIAALVADLQPQRAVVALEHLSELLHASLRDDSRDEIPVSEEVLLAERYLALQVMRFGDRLRYELRVASDVGECPVPVLLLQPLVENAVMHGLEGGAERLHITVEANRSPNGVEIRVENDGTPLEAEGSRRAGHGVGLAATRARLATAYGDRASLELLPREGGGVVVSLTVPGAMEVNVRQTPALVGAP
ncbi:MAG: signal transduction histidine kinase, LytS, partial [Geminicoccaceae bacterium]|nr:signal transduction histidine kinase, LytS [Geminicoccaceae bacterium]